MKKKNVSWCRLLLKDYKELPYCYLKFTEPLKYTFWWYFSLLKIGTYLSLNWPCGCIVDFSVPLTFSVVGRQEAGDNRPARFSKERRLSSQQRPHLLRSNGQDWSVWRCGTSRFLRAPSLFSSFRPNFGSHIFPLYISISFCVYCYHSLYEVV